MPLTTMTTIAQTIQNIPLDADDFGSVATIILLQIMAQLFGDDLFKALVGLGCLFLVLLSALRLSIKAWKEYQEARMVKYKADKEEHDK